MTTHGSNPLSPEATAAFLALEAEVSDLDHITHTETGYLGPEQLQLRQEVDDLFGAIIEHLEGDCCEDSVLPLVAKLRGILRQLSDATIDCLVGRAEIPDSPTGDE